MEFPSPRVLPLTLELEQLYESAICSLRLMLLPGASPAHKPRCFALVGGMAGDVSVLPCDSSSLCSQRLPTEHHYAVTALASGCITQPISSKTSKMREIISISSDGTLCCTPLIKTADSTPKFHQIIQSNVNAAHIIDVDKDGWEELVVSMTDRVVRTFRYQPELRRLVPLHKWDVPSQITAFAIGESSSYENLGDVEMWLSQMSANYYVNLNMSKAHAKVHSGNSNRYADSLIMPYRSLYISLGTSCLLSLIIVANQRERLLQNPCGPIRSAAALKCDSFNVVVTLHASGKDLLLYGYNERNIKDSSISPIARVQLLWRADTLSAIQWADDIMLALSDSTGRLDIYRLPVANLKSLITTS